MRITVLGGAGKMGCIAVQDLANDPRVNQVVIADFNVEQAEIVANYINSPKIIIKQIDLNNHTGLVNVLKDADACLNATVYYTNLSVMDACIESGTHYTDMGGLFFTTRKQLELHDKYKNSNISAVLGMGSAPGIPNIQARYAADRLDTIEYIKIYDGIKPPKTNDPKFTYAVPTILDELTMKPMIFENGEFSPREPLSDFEDYWFTEPIGLLPMHLSLHSEVATLPISYKDKGIQQCFFKINYWGMSKQVVEKIRVLDEFGFSKREAVSIDGAEIVPRELMVKLLGDYVPPITDFLASPANQPPDWVKEIVTVVKGTKEGREISYRLGTLTCKGALPTGVAPAIAAIWLAEGKISSGVYPPEISIDPEPFFNELKTREIYTQVTITSQL
jgi:lysine 6-dehydrogenase